MWRRLLYGAMAENLDFDEARKRALATLIFFIVIPFLILFSINHFRQGGYLIAVLTGIFALILMTSVALIQLVKRPFSMIWFFRLNIILAWALFIYFVGDRSTGLYSTLWLFVFPLVAFFILGKREGFLWAAGLFVASSLFMFLPMMSRSYTLDFRIRFLSALFIVSVIAYVFEAIRDRFQHTVEAQYTSLKIARDEAREASRAKGVFLANMSHEFRTPLNHIIGFTELVLNGSIGKLNKNQEENLQVVLKSSKHLLLLINDILDLSNVESGTLKLHPESFDFKALLESSVSTVREMAKQRSIHIDLHHNGAPMRVCADRHRLKQIMYNLLSNAVKFTPENGSVTVRAESVDSLHRRGVLEQRSEADVEEDLEDSRYVRVSVQDTGIGIIRENLEKIFSPFEQVERSQSRRYPGTGLGLALSRKLVSLHGGTIWAESRGEGRGSTFIFVLPCRMYGDS
jgi:signal transduction histidine kinase